MLNERKYNAVNCESEGAVVESVADRNSNSNETSVCFLFFLLLVGNVLM
jgi:hypothetical protein